MTAAPTLSSLGDGLHRITMPLPWALRHVHAYALEGEGGWTIVDAGLGVPDAKQHWRAVLEALGSPPVAQLVVTHFHPDHIGGSADLVAVTGCAVLQGALDAEQAGHWRNPASVAGAATAHLRAHGLPADIAEEGAALVGAVGAVLHIAEPTRLLGDGAGVDAAGERWQVVGVPGHADGHIALFAPGSRRLIAGDAILPDITPNVAVYPGGRADPLADFLASLGRIAGLAPSLVLPGHGDPFANAAVRVAALYGHHEARLAEHRTALVPGPLDAYHVSLHVFGPNLDPVDRRFAVGETVAHLVHLERRGEVRRIEASSEPIRFTLNP